MRTRVVLAWVLAALVTVGVVAVALIPLVPGSTGRGGLDAAILAACWAITGALLITARPRNAVGWLVLLCGVLQGWANFGNEYGSYGVAVADPGWPLADWVAQSSSMIYLPSLILPITVILAVYPDGRLASRRWRLPVIATSVGLAAITLGAMLTQDAYDDIAPGPAPVDLAVPVGWWSTLAWGASTTSAVGRDRGHLGDDRLPTCPRHVAGACPAGLVRSHRRARASCSSSSPPLPEWGALIVGLSIPLAIAVGVLRYRMLDIVLRPVIVYGGLTAVVVAVFVAVSALAGSALERGPLPGVIAAALVAVGLTPARDRVQRGADRFVYGERRDPMRAVVRLGDGVESADPQSLLDVVVASVADAVRAPGASVTGQVGQLLAMHGAVPQTAVTFPLVVAGDSVGTLRVAPRVAGSSYSAADGRVLGALAPQVAVVVHALDLAGALEVQRDRVVAATRSERDRLRHELHDGLGPTLAGTALGLRAAQDALAAEDDVTLGRLLDRIGAEVDLAVADVRRVIDDLRPAELDEGSLDLAVRRRAASVASVVDVDVDFGAIPELRPEVEIAAYRIASEALNNVARHAGAQHVRLAVSVGDGSLTLRVADDGSGIPESAPAGVGLESMRRRAQAVGGDFDVDSGQDGTVVTARLPL